MLTFANVCPQRVHVLPDPRCGTCGTVRRVGVNGQMICRHCGEQGFSEPPAAIKQAALAEAAPQTMYERHEHITGETGKRQHQDREVTPEGHGTAERPASTAHLHCFGAACQGRQRIAVGNKLVCPSCGNAIDPPKEHATAAAAPPPTPAKASEPPKANEPLQRTQERVQRYQEQRRRK